MEIDTVMMNGKGRLMLAVKDMGFSMAMLFTLEETEQIKKALKVK